MSKMKKQTAKRLMHAKWNQPQEHLQRKDGSVVVIRPGFRPRVLSKAEVEALKTRTDDR